MIISICVDRLALCNGSIVAQVVTRICRVPIVSRLYGSLRLRRDGEEGHYTFLSFTLSISVTNGFGLYRMHRIEVCIVDEIESGCRGRSASTVSVAKPVIPCQNLIPLSARIGGGLKSCWTISLGHPSPPPLTSPLYLPSPLHPPKEEGGRPQHHGGDVRPSLPGHGRR